MGRAREDAERYLAHVAEVAGRNPNMPKEAIRAMYVQGIILAIADLTDAVERMTYVNGGGDGD